MTEQEILNYFDNNKVYKYLGSIKDFNNFINDLNISYNYIVTNDTVYFVAHEEVSSSSVIAIN